MFQLEAEAALILREPSALPRELVLALIARERIGAPTCAGVAREEETWRDPMWMIANALSHWPAFAGLEPQKAATIWESLVRYATGCPWGEEWDLFEEHFNANPGTACYSSPRDAFVSCWGRGDQRVALVGPQIVDDAGWLANHYPLACRDFEKPRNRPFLRFVSLCYYLQRLGDEQSSFFLSRSVAGRVLEIRSVRELQTFFRRALELKILRLLEPGCRATKEATYYSFEAPVEVPPLADDGADDDASDEEGILL